MKVNRYTQYTPAKYNPRSLQELMVAPMYMRQNHDAMDAGMAEAQTALAQIDYDPIHEELVGKTQEELNNELQAQAEALANEGFNNNTKGKFLKFNKQYQQAIGPKGPLGKAQSYKTSKIQERDAYIQNMTAKGYSPKDAALDWDEHVANHESAFDGKNITNISPLYGNNYINLNESIDSAIKILGSDARQYIKDNNYSVGTDPQTGMLVFKTPQGSIATSNNIPNIEAATKALNDEWLSESGAGYKSNKTQRMTKDHIINTINNRLGIAKQTSYSDTSTYGYQFKSPANTTEEEKNNNFVNNIIKSYTTSNLSPQSPLIGLNNVDEIVYNDNGEIITGEGQFNTYKDKVEYYDKNHGVSDVEGPNTRFNPQKGLYEVRKLNKNNYSLGSSIQWEEIPKDPNHFKEELRTLTKDNPFFKGLTEQESINKLYEYKQNLASNFVTSVDFVGSDYKWLNEKLFGSGENSVGTFNDKGATINGSQLTANEIVSDLGFDNDATFKKEGKPTIKGYIPALGQYEVSVLDSKGNINKLFIEADKQLQDSSQLTMNISANLLEGKDFVNLGPHSTDRNYTMYMVNDYSGNPYIIFSTNRNARKASEIAETKDYVSGLKTVLKNDQDQMYRFNDVSAMEKIALLRSPFYKKLAGLKQ